MSEIFNDPSSEIILIALATISALLALMLALRSFISSRESSLLTQRVYHDLIAKSERSADSGISKSLPDHYYTDRNEIDSLTRTYLEKLQHELYENRQISMELRNLLVHSVVPLNERNLEDIADLIKDTIHDQNLSNSGKGDNSTQSQIVKEINHALKTPLASISALTKVLDDNDDEDVRKASKQISAASQVCNYYLNAFRSLIYEGGTQRDESNIDFERSLVEAIRIYESQTDKDLIVRVSVPKKQASVSLYYSIAVIMPLIENAVEAAPDGTTITIQGSEVDGALRLDVSNECLNAPPLEIYQRGYMTKGQTTNEGLGLTIVRNLLSGLAIGELSHRYGEKEKRITFTVRMADKQ